MEEAVAAAGGDEGQGAVHKRKAWAKSRDSWQASEAERLSPEAPELNPGREGGNIPNEKIAIWLKDCRTPLGASLDEQSNLTLKGMLVRNGGSFEDDLSLGAEVIKSPVGPTMQGPSPLIAIPYVIHLLKFLGQHEIDFGEWEVPGI